MPAGIQKEFTGAQFHLEFQNKVFVSQKRTVFCQNMGTESRDVKEARWY